MTRPLRVLIGCATSCVALDAFLSRGHSFAHPSGLFIDAWGDGPLLIRDGKRRWYFEFSEMFGPIWLKRDREGHFDPSDKQPMDGDPFWSPFTRWNNAGRKCRPITTRRGRLIVYLCHVPPEAP